MQFLPSGHRAPAAITIKQCPVRSNPIKLDSQSFGSISFIAITRKLQTVQCDGLANRRLNGK
uniref:Uncharacterized protein n=1 Tax=Anguilla anguilla TaxID=7936 RepID=A0A0E9UXQ8_ANGAN